MGDSLLRQGNLELVGSIREASGVGFCEYFMQLLKAHTPTAHVAMPIIGLAIEPLHFFALKVCRTPPAYYDALRLFGDNYKRVHSCRGSSFHPTIPPINI